MHRAVTILVGVPLAVALAATLCAGLVSLQSSTEGLSDLIIGVRGCLAIPEGQALGQGAPLIVLAADQRPREVSAAAVTERSVGADCVRRWRERLPPRSGLARVELPEPLEHEVIFVIPGRPGLRVLGGPPTRLSAQETARVFRAAASSLPESWRTKKLLMHSYRYGRAAGHGAVELYVGRPILNPRGASPPIRAISIRRVFLVAGRVLASEEYERVSGREERAETEPPELTFDNWSASDTERTVAFISTDGGGSWRRLSTDVGFEGINWVAQKLRDGLPDERWFLYTHH